MRKINFGVIDCETDPFEKGIIPRPFIWGFYDGKIYKKFDDTESLVNYIKNLSTTLYAHNGGKFDFHYLLEYATHGKTVSVINGRLAKFYIGKCELRDSFCILPTALKNFNKTEIDYRKLHASQRYLWMEEIESYLKDDCINLYHFIEKFKQSYGNKLTLASSALNFFKEFQKVEIDNTNKEFFEKFRQYYNGGRVQCFEYGEIKGDIKLIDINSAYPHAMTFNHACGKVFSVSTKLPEANIEQCFITIECISKGAFPLKEKNKTNYPNDNIPRLYNVTGWEYISAKKLGLIREEKIIEVISFEKSINFTPYVNHFFTMKAESKISGDKAQYIFSKLFMNSLYGKFAANPQKYKEFVFSEHTHIEDYEVKGYTVGSIIDNDTILFERPLKESSHRYYNVATAASITGFVRAMLLESINACERPLYCDTDSIFYIGNSKADMGKKLGQWDKEAEGDTLYIAGKKLYAFMSKKEVKKIASKGVKLSAKEIIKISIDKNAHEIYIPINPTYSIKKGIYFQSRKVKQT